MKTRVASAFFLACSLGSLAAQDYPIQSVPFTSVRVTDTFWAPRIRRNHDVTIPIAIAHCYRTGRVDNFLIAAKVKPGSFRTVFPFDDTDIYKIIEGASYSLQTFPDQGLKARIDTLVGIIGKAQEPDGYLYTCRTINPENPHPWAGKNRWEKDPELSHELYNCGHLYEAAVAHYLSTGEKTLLAIALKNANLLCRDFGPGKLAYYPGHQVVEMGLVKLYRITRERKYLDLAQFFLDCRRNGSEYNQAHLPVVEQTEPVGHAVRATYMYSGMADVAALTGNDAYVKALNAIWENLVGQKTYLTGGIGSEVGNEGFSLPYELPNRTAYNETCASIGNAFWNHRMFLLHGDAKYVDVLERILYNGMLSGVSLSGDRFFYPNPLESTGQVERSEWFGCACCPGNVCRFIPSVPGMAYATGENRLYVNLFIAGTASIDLDGNALQVEQKTDYPWNGDVVFSVRPQKTALFDVAIRIPGWARNQPVPSRLYAFNSRDSSAFLLSVNRKPALYRMEKGYAVINRKWKKGDTIRLSLPMPVRWVVANDSVKADQGRMALQRGPLVYCLEWPDQNDQHVLHLVLDRDKPLHALFRPDLLDGVVAITGKAKSFRQSESGGTSESEADFLAIPYYAWANRGPGEMAVWLPLDSAEHPLPLPTIASRSTVRASVESKSLVSLNDQFEPSGSDDRNVPYYSWWPIKDTTQWVQYVFAKPESVSSVQVYWRVDEPRGRCRLPENWKILYQDVQGLWKNFPDRTGYPINKDRFNEVRFDPVLAQSIKLEVRLRQTNTAGIYEWKVE
ncbi:MAG TPA: glycoside hydrolase family 127 protein [bacterium]